MVKKKKEAATAEEAKKKKGAGTVGVKATSNVEATDIFADYEPATVEDSKAAPAPVAPKQSAFNFNSGGNAAKPPSVPVEDPGASMLDFDSD